MKKLLFVFLLLVSLASAGQTPGTAQNYTPISQRYNWLAGYFRALGLPAICGFPSLTTGQWTGAGAIKYDSCGQKIYFWTGSIWRPLADSSSITPMDSTAVDSVYLTPDSSLVARHFNGNKDTIIDLSAITGNLDSLIQSALVQPGTTKSNTVIDYRMYANRTYLDGGELASTAFSGDWAQISTNIRSQGSFDGVRLANDDDSTLYMLGGALNGNCVQGTDSIYKSLDNGVTWSPHTLLLPFPAHQFTFVQIDDGDWVMMGGDPCNTATEKKTVSLTRHFTSWTTQTTNAAYGARSLSAGVYHQGRLFMLGGQTDVVPGFGDPTAYMSEDKGKTWTQVNVNIDSAAWLGRNITNCAKSFNGRIVVTSGGYYDSTGGTANFTYSQRCYSANYDSVTNSLNFRREQDIPISGRQYPFTQVWDGKYWFGFGFHANNQSDIIYMDKSWTWHTYSPVTTHPNTHAVDVIVFKDHLISAMGNTLNDAWTFTRNGQANCAGTAGQIAWYATTGNKICNNTNVTQPVGTYTLQIERSTNSGLDVDIPTLLVSNPDVTSGAIAQGKAKVGGGDAAGNPEVIFAALGNGSSGTGFFATLSNHNLRLGAHNATEITLKPSGDIVFTSYAGGGSRMLYIDNTGTWKYSSAFTSGTNIGIGGTPVASALLDMQSTSQGLLAPRMTGAQQNAISSPATGLLIYNTDSLAFTYYNGTIWQKIGTGSGGGTHGIDDVLAVGQQFTASRSIDANGFPFHIINNNETPATFERTTPNATATASAIELLRNVTGATNEGVNVAFNMKNASGSIVTAGKLDYRWQSATAGSEASYFMPVLINSGSLTNPFIFYGDGNAQFTTLPTSDGTKEVRIDGSGNLSQYQAKYSKGITIELPSAAENIGMWKTPVDITISDVQSVLVGSASPSVSFNIAFGSDRTSGTNVFSSGQTVTSTTTGLNSNSGFNDQTIPAGSFIWVTTSAQSGTVTQIEITVNYTED